MNAGDIIAAASRGSWGTTECSSGGLILTRGTDSCRHPQAFLQVVPTADAMFMSAFDPEHIALMEAVVEAAERSAPWVHTYDPYGEQSTGAAEDCITEAENDPDLDAALDALTAYRTERVL